MIEVIPPCLIHVLHNIFYNNKKKAHAMIMKRAEKGGMPESSATFLHEKLTF